MFSDTHSEINIVEFIESMADGVLAVNTEGNISLVNSAICAMTGYTKNELIGAKLSILLPEKARKHHGEYLDQFFSNPKPRSMANNLEITTQDKQGNSFPVEIGISSVSSPIGPIAIALIKNISVRKKAEEALIRQNAELDSFAHMVAHDIRSIITTIVGYSEYLLNNKDCITKEQNTKYLREIATAGRKMGNITQDILLFASMKKQDIELVPVVASDYLHSALERLKFTIEEKQAVITTDKNLPHCCGYGPWIEETWYNYIINALNYGGIKPQIHIGFEAIGNGYIGYYVKDSGPGIAAEQLNTLFEAKDNMRDKFIKGTGLGLPMVKNIIEKLDGYVELKNSKSGGCKFLFYLKSVENIDYYI